MAEPARNSRQDRTYSKNVATDHSRQQNGDQHHRYERVEAVYHGDVQRITTPTGRGSILSPTRWLTTRENGEALIDAARQGQIERMRRVLASKYTDIDFMDKQKTTPLLAAIQGKQLTAVTLLLKEGADPGRRYSSAQETPLILAVKLDCRDIVKALLQHNASANDSQIVVKDGTKVRVNLMSMTVDSLIDAARRGQIDCLDELLSKQCIDVNCFDDRGMTALLAAIENKRSAAVTMLLERGALPDLRYNEQCKTPLMLAAYSGNVDIVRALLKHGAPPVGLEIGEEAFRMNRRYYQDEFDALRGGPIDITRTPIFTSEPEIVLELLKRGVPVQKGALLSALEHLREENMEVVQRLIDAGADVEAQDDYGERPRHFAACRGLTRAIEILHAAGADLEARRCDGWTGLHLAVTCGTLEARQKFIVLGANVDARNNGGWTPLYYASGRHDYEAVQLLLANGSDASVVDNQGLTPYDLACQSTGAGKETEKRKVIDLLRSHMDLDNDGAEVKSFATAYSRPDGGMDMEESDVSSDGTSTPPTELDVMRQVAS
ncbi:putative ankyrin repeat protein [Pseudocercospora fuligena]|uniref:Putative ankyrin repeat protein n=1 Tax=Pseudocercospora fuligena TaxID=685502 RepID=A0A8H6RT24_9PEZI|nr:putative ankyrin repeat protein [Pseudocercospora fuligena]